MCWNNRVLVFMLLFCCLWVGNGFAFEHEESGDIPYGTVWDDFTEPYYVVGNLTVLGLTIQPGVSVLFLGDYSFEVTGILKALGTEENQILFASAPDNPGGWRGIKIFSTNPANELAFCTIQDATSSGILIQNCAPNIHDCTITDNSSSSDGGGVKVLFDSVGFSSTLRIERCIITSNHASNEGGGISAQISSGSAQIIGCLIENNTVNTPYVARGGGVYADVETDGEFTLLRSTIQSNTARSSRADGSTYARGGGLYCSGAGTLNVSTTIVDGNHISATQPGYHWGSSYSQGGGLSLFGTGQYNITNSIVRNNTLHAGDHEGGGGIFVSSGSMSVINSSILRNELEGIYRSGGTVEVRNTIIYDNTGSTVYGEVSLEFCDVDHIDVSGTNNISDPPGLDSSDQVQWPSLCVNAGDPDPLYNDIWFPPSVSAPLDDPGMPMERNDIGAHGGPQANYWFDEPTAPGSISIVSEADQITISWEACDEYGLEAYLIFRSELSNDDEADLLATVEIGTENYFDISVTPGTQYYYRIRTENSGGAESSFSAEVCATPGDTERPTQPANLDASDPPPGDRIITLTWDSNQECDLVSYWITRTPEGGSPAVIDTIADSGGSSMTYVDTDVENFIEYCYQIRAIDNSGLASEYSDTICAMAQGAVADLAMVKTVDITNPNVGESVTYTLEVTNNGPETAFNTLAVDTLNSIEGLTYVSHVPSQGEYGNLTGEWDIGELENGATATLTIVATVDTSAVTLTNTASVSDDSSSDNVPENNTDSASVVGHACFLELTKSVDNTEPNVGDEIVFKVKVVNQGPDVVEDVVVTDALPGGLSYTSVIKSSGTYIGDFWRLGNMSVGQIDSMLVYATVVEAASITNYATVSVAQPPNLNPENEAHATVSGHSADLSLAVSALPIDPAVDDPVTFRLIIHNSGPSTSTNIVVIDAMPAGLANVVSGTPPIGTTFADSTWSIDELEVGGYMQLNFSATMASEGSVTNQVRIVSSDQADPDPNNNQAFVTLSTEPADLSLTKRVDQIAPALGDTVTFTMILANNSSNNDATGIEVLDLAAPGLTFVDVSATAGSYNLGTGIWSVDLLANSDSDTLTIEAQIDLATTIVNTATIVGADQADSDSENNSAEVTIEGRAADLAITKTLDNSYPATGDIITFVVTIKNNGPSNAGDIHVQDLLPASVLELHGYNQTGVGYDEIFGDWEVGGLLVDETKIFTLQALVLAEQPFTNTAEISGSSLPDPRLDNNLASAGGHLTFADLALSKTVNNDTPAINSEVTYTLTVTNAGPNNVTDVLIQDVLPQGVTYISHTASTGDYVNSLWTIDSLLDEATATLDIVVMVDLMEEITNQAEIISMVGIDDNLNDNSAIEDIFPHDPPPTVTITSISAAAVGESIDVVATAIDNTGIEEFSVTLHFREGITGEYSILTMIPGSAADSYEGTIPGIMVTANGVDCYVSARDLVGGLGESTRGEVMVTVELVTNPSSQPGGSAQSAYRMISIPLDLDDARPGPVMEDDLGTYDPDKWKMFGLNESQSWENSEFPNCGDVIPGRGFFLIVKEAGKIIDAGPGNTVPVGESFAVNLHAGWNLIGNPYKFTVPMAGISLESGNALDVRNYIGSWATLSGSSSLEPFNGYLVAADSDDDRLLFDPVGAQNKNLPVIKSVEPLWSVGIEAMIDSAVDNDNVAAVYDKAETGRDQLDRPEPPVIGDFVSVGFPHPEWETPFPAYCQDARPVDTKTGGQSWDFEVRTNLKGQINLTFSGVESVPEGLQVWLRDEFLMINVDLRKTADYTYVGASNGTARAMKLVIGDEEFIAESLPASESIPRQVILMGNYPNPFNPITTIRYGLPRDGKVKLGIYDLRGRLVTTLVDEVRRAGYHAVVWEGADQVGRRVASGVYLYRLVTDDVVKTEKMLLIK